jgi:hypothetical protein
MTLQLEQQPKQEETSRVVAARDTSLALNANITWASETGWNGSGGTSHYGSEPAYQRERQ